MQQWQNADVSFFLTTIASLGFAWFAAKGSAVSWGFGLLNAIVSLTLSMLHSSFIHNLAMLLFLFLCAWGLYTWKYGIDRAFRINKIIISTHIKAISSIVIGSILLYTASYFYEGEINLYFAVHFSASMVCIYLTIRRILEVWFYWASVNVVHAFMLLQLEQYLSLSVILIYIPLMVRGLYRWNARYYEQLEDHAPPSTRQI